MNEDLENKIKRQELYADMGILMGKKYKNQLVEISGFLSKFDCKIAKNIFNQENKNIDFSPVMNVLKQAEMIFDEILEKESEKWIVVIMENIHFVNNVDLL